ncbi:MAG TPA: family 43 glycosylhydrolase [Puia sp.]
MRIAKPIALLLGTLLCVSFLHGQSGRAPVGVADRPVWVSDQGDGTYRNPILYADYSDPDAVRVGDDYYMTASSFNCIPGLPILHSRDLVNWTLIGHALPRLDPEEIYEKPQHGNGVWAPAIRWFKGEFYIYYPDPDFGIYVVKARNPAGPWSKPVLVVGGKGLIDPCPLFENDGKVWLVNAWAGSRAEVNSLLTIRALRPDGLSVEGEPRMVYDGHDRQPTIEGPKLYKRNGYYYILAPAGGVTGGWQLALRSKNIYGPYEEKIVMDQGATPINGPHQGAWVDTKTGESWFLHFQDRGAYGRITHLQPLHWVKDWPVIGIDKDGDGKGEPVLVYKKPNVGVILKTGKNAGETAEMGLRKNAGEVAERRPIARVGQESDEFDGDRPGLQWQWHANPKITWMAEIPGSGYLRLFAMKQPAGSRNFWEVPNLLLQKFPAPDFTATTKMRLVAEQDGKKTGLLVMGGDYAYLAIQKEKEGYVLVQVVCKNAEKGEEERVVARQVLPVETIPVSDGRGMDVKGSEGKEADGRMDAKGGEGKGTTLKSASPMVYCRVEVRSPDAQCRFAYSLDGNTYTLVGEPFYAKPDKWIGAKVGVFCLSLSDARNGGYADVDWFRIGK